MEFNVETLIKLITEDKLILIPVLFFIGLVIKNTLLIADRFIPIILIILGIAFSVAMSGINIDSVIQGVLVSGASVLANEVKKQAKRKDV